MTLTRRSLRSRHARYTSVAVGVVALALTATACGGSNSAKASSDSGASAAPSQSSAQSGSDTSAAQSAQTDFTSYTSTKSFDDTESALKKAVSDSGMMVLGDMNQAGALKSTGLNLKGAHTYFVGNPAKGKMFFQQNPAIGAEIPVRMYVWADSDGTAHVGYFDPAAMFTAIDPKLADGGKQMAMAADKIAQGASGGKAEAGTKVDVSFVSEESTKSFSDTEKDLKKSVASSGMMTLGDLNQAGALKATGLNLKGAHAYFVGNPAKGKMFFEQDPAIGAVIPLGMYVWADSDGTAHVGYFDPAALFTAVNSKLADGGKQMAMAAKKIADGAAK
ncbi:DUF302 domain-containing protein [Streptomyces ardesiacus]|uniref:DUF302 domain-containing protein n=1 Tax=Streptomyces ardesiacus TaxID=285564 RepID=UPI0007C6C5A7|nr:DUF302 domain-containing protein [Streptomyces sp. NBRC 110030]